jgi:hypothetical protein
MAWHLPQKSGGWDINTADFAPQFGRRSMASLDDLLPGDTLLDTDHIEQFEKWVDQGNHSRGAFGIPRTPSAKKPTTTSTPGPNSQHTNPSAIRSPPPALPVMSRWLGLSGISTVTAGRTR